MPRRESRGRLGFPSVRVARHETWLSRIRLGGHRVPPAASVLLVLAVLVVSALCATNNLPSRLSPPAAQGSSAFPQTQAVASVPVPAGEFCDTPGSHGMAAAPVSCVGDTAVKAPRDQNQAGQPGQPSDPLPLSLRAHVPGTASGIPEFSRPRPAVTPSLAQLSISRT